jgi:hypothetical protein
MAPFLFFDLIKLVGESIEEATRMKRVTVLFAAFLLFSACQAKPLLLKPRLEGEGAVTVYLQSFPKEAEGLIFRMEGIYAIRQDGEAIPLSLQVKEFSGKKMNREILLAAGDLPPGQYAGFSFRLKDATLKSEEGEIALVAAEETPRALTPFSVTSGKAVREYLGEGFRFTPSFSATVPGKTPAGLVGVVSSRGSNTATMFDKVSGRVAGVIPTGASPAGMV